MTNYRPKRRITRFPVTLIDDGATLDVVVRDISLDGARVDIDPAAPILAGTALNLQIGAAQLPALVQWSRKGALGLRFMGRPDPQLINLIPVDD